jgi:hypothetical protein
VFGYFFKQTAQAKLFGRYYQIILSLMNGSYYTAALFLSIQFVCTLESRPQSPRSGPRGSGGVPPVNSLTLVRPLRIRRFKIPRAIQGFIFEGMEIEAELFGEGVGING